MASSSRLGIPFGKAVSRKTVDTIEVKGGKGELCFHCREHKSAYRCPKCQAPYCSAECYKAHNSSCSEAFYKQEVETELSLRGKGVSKYKVELAKLLRRTFENREVSVEDLQSVYASDSESEGEREGSTGLESLLAKLELASKDDDIDEIIATLSPEQRQNFFKAVKSGALSEMAIEDGEPWYVASSRLMERNGQEGNYPIRITKEVPDARRPPLVEDLGTEGGISLRQASLNSVGSEAAGSQGQVATPPLPLRIKSLDEVVRNTPNEAGQTIRETAQTKRPSKRVFFTIIEAAAAYAATSRLYNVAGPLHSCEVSNAEIMNAIVNAAPSLFGREPPLTLEVALQEVARFHRERQFGGTHETPEISEAADIFLSKQRAVEAEQTRAGRESSRKLWLRVVLSDLICLLSSKIYLMRCLEDIRKCVDGTASALEIKIGSAKEMARRETPRQSDLSSSQQITSARKKTREVYFRPPEEPQRGERHKRKPKSTEKASEERVHLERNFWRKELKQLRLIEKKIVFLTSFISDFVFESSPEEQVDNEENEDTFVYLCSVREAIRLWCEAERIELLHST